MDLKRFKGISGRRIARGAALAVAPCLLACVLSGAADAYTLVMRGGRRVEISGGYELTRTTLTYEVSPGVSVTLPLDHIDIAGTERANNEPAGSFASRAPRATGQPAPTVPAAASPRAATRSVTNADLEATRRARVESELNYERRRKELGLPSAEEMRRHNEREEARMREVARQKAERDAAEESYRRARAEELRSGVAELEAEVNYLRRRLDGQPNGPVNYYSPGGVLVVADRTFGRRRSHLPHFPRTDPFRPLRRAHPGAFGQFGQWHGPRVRHGASVGFGVNGGSRAVIRFGGRGFQGPPAGRR